MKPAGAADGANVKDPAIDAHCNLNDSTKQECRVAEALTDKGCHKTETLAWLREKDIRSYVAAGRWGDKPEGWQEAVHENRRRPSRKKVK